MHLFEPVLDRKSNICTGAFLIWISWKTVHVKNKSLSGLFSSLTEAFTFNFLSVTSESRCPWQIRPLNCGRWVRETRDRRDTTWKMRGGGSRTTPPSPPCRWAHTHTHTCKPSYAQLQAGLMSVCPHMPPDSLNLWFWAWSPLCLCIKGPGAETHRFDGRGSSQASVLQRAHLPRQLHLSQQRRGDLPVCWRSPHQHVAPGHHRPQLQYPLLHGMRIYSFSFHSSSLVDNRPWSSLWGRFKNK